MLLTPPCWEQLRDKSIPLGFYGMNNLCNIFSMIVMWEIYVVRFSMWDGLSHHLSPNTNLRIWTLVVRKVHLTWKTTQNASNLLPLFMLTVHLTVWWNESHLAIYPRLLVLPISQFTTAMTDHYWSLVTTRYQFSQEQVTTLTGTYPTNAAHALFLFQ